MLARHSCGTTSTSDRFACSTHHQSHFQQVMSLDYAWRDTTSKKEEKPSFYDRLFPLTVAQAVVACTSESPCSGKYPMSKRNRNLHKTSLGICDGNIIAESNNITTFIRSIPQFDGTPTKFQDWKHSTTAICWCPAQAFFRFLQRKLAQMLYTQRAAV